jgi:hypothetical protein
VQTRTRRDHFNLAYSVRACCWMGNVRVGILPERKEILIRTASGGVVAPEARMHGQINLPQDLKR